MSYKVTNVREVNYLGMSEEERKEIWRLDDLRFQQMTTSFFDDGEYFALYEDIDNPADNTTNDSTYAVYMGKSGELLCLLADSGVALTACDDSEYGERRAALYKQIAIAAGWPEKLPIKKRYTVQLHRILDVEVTAENEEQAAKIGELLASHNVTVGVEKALREAWTANSTGQYDEFGYVRPAEPENIGVWDLTISSYEGDEILKKED